ncbi:MAG: hypothetical protein ACI86C_000069, partial [Candidatus Latescibacterota bacterium]
RYFMQLYCPVLQLQNKRTANFKQFFLFYFVSLRT